MLTLAIVAVFVELCPIHLNYQDRRYFFQPDGRLCTHTSLTFFILVIVNSSAMCFFPKGIHVIVILVLKVEMLHEGDGGFTILCCAIY